MLMFPAQRRCSRPTVGTPLPLSSILRDCDQKLAVASCRRKTTAAGRVPQMDGMGVGRHE